MTHYTTPDFYLADEWLVQPRLNQIRHGDTSYQIEPKVMHVLVCLARDPQEVIAKEQLLDTVWADAIVVDKVLARAISELRKVFGDSPRTPHIIETIPRVGYRLIAPLSFPYSGDSTPAAALDITPEGMLVIEPVNPKLPWGKVSVLVGIAFILGGVSWSGISHLLTARKPSIETISLTSFPGQEVAPALSPDGQSVAFMWDGAGEQRGMTDIYIQQPGMDMPVQRTVTPKAFEAQPMWSANGQELAFVRMSQEGCGIYIVSAIGGNERKLATCPPRTIMTGVDWSPDGEWLAFSVRSERGSPMHLVLFDIQTGEAEPLTDPSASVLGDSEPKFSPDGRFVLFRRSLTSRTQDVYQVQVATKAVQRLTFDNRDLMGYTWKPNGEQVLFSSDRSGRYTLWQVGLDGTGLREVVPGSWNLKQPTLSQDGKRLAYERWLYDTNIWALPLSTSSSDTLEEQRQVISSTLWDQQPSFSPDGSRIAFVSNRSGPYEIWLSNADGSLPRQLTRFDGSYVGNPDWSPDSRRLAFEVYKDGQALLYQMEASGGIPRLRIAKQTGDAILPHWSSDGTSLYYASNQNGTWQIWEHAEGHEPAQITTDGGYAMQEDPSGTVLYYTKSGLSGLWRRSLTDTTEAQVITTLQPYDWGSWAIAEASLYYVERTLRAEAILKRLDVAQGDTSEVTRFDPRLMWHQNNFSVSPDGDVLLYTQVDQSESDIVLLDGWVP